MSVTTQDNGKPFPAEPLDTIRYEYTYCNKENTCS